MCYRKNRAMAASGSRMYGTSEVVALLEDDDRCEAEFGNLDLEGESEDEFEAVGDFLMILGANRSCLMNFVANEHKCPCPCSRQPQSS